MLFCYCFIYLEKQNKTIMKLTLKHGPNEYGEGSTKFFSSEITIGEKPSDCIQVMHTNEQECVQATALILNGQELVEEVEKLLEVLYQNQDAGRDIYTGHVEAVERLIKKSKSL